VLNGRNPRDVASRRTLLTLTPSPLWAFPQWKTSTSAADLTQWSRNRPNRGCATIRTPREKQRDRRHDGHAASEVARTLTKHRRSRARGRFEAINLFNQILPRAAAWVQQQEQLVLANEESLILIPEGHAIARRAGVAPPQAVRILGLLEIPLPEEADLREAAVAIASITPNTAGLTIGHGIFIRRDCLQNSKLIAHELKHVEQYERYGSIPVFLQQYLSEVNQYGYPAAPMEQEAIVFAESVFPSHD
jgi:hypothetical protein